MNHKLAAALTTILGAVLGVDAHALGLSNIEISSKLNEPLNARIRVLSIPKLDNNANDLKISLATAEAFRRAGLEYPQSLTGIRFSYEPKGATDGVIQIGRAHV